MILSKCVACNLPIKKIWYRAQPTYVHTDKLYVILLRSVKAGLAPSHSTINDNRYGGKTFRGEFNGAGRITEVDT